MTAAAGLVSGRWRTVSGAVLLALGLALVIHVTTAEGPDAGTGAVGGDYPSFVAAGERVRDAVGASAEDLYDPARQFAAQEPLLPADAGGYLYFAYPAFFAAPYALLSLLPFGASYLVHTLAMAGFLAAAVALARPMSGILQRHPLEAYAAALTFFPLFRGVAGGQNTALSVLLVVEAWRGFRGGRDGLAGVAVGLLLFKPPLALPFLAAIVLARRWRSVAAAAATGGALYAVGAVLTDPAWPAAWVDAVRYLGRVDTPANVENFVSVPGVAEAVFGIGTLTAHLVGYGLAVAALAVVAWAWWGERGSIDVRMALTVAAALVVSPHALYYDAGLLVLAFLVLADQRAGSVRTWGPILWASGLVHLLAPRLGASPLVLLVVLAFVASACALWKGPAPTPPADLPSSTAQGSSS